MTSMLGAAVAAITAALLFYTIGVFGEQRAGILKGRHLAFFWAGLVFDLIGTSIMDVLPQPIVPPVPSSTQQPEGSPSSL